jgi:septal ring factor EnvC (AmiA/AmiB activator)
MLLPPVQGIDLEELALEMRATDAMWQEARHQHQAILDAATSTLVSSKAKAPVYATYRQRLLELAREAEATEAAAREQRAAMRAEQRRQQRAAAAGRKAARAQARAQPPAADFVPPAPPAPTTAKVREDRVPPPHSAPPLPAWA